MAEIRLTAAQQAAVDDCGGALLVSAAAGSGKTKVLVDRLMRHICDPVHPANINSFLMITYTKAAASELRGKISRELGKRLANEPDNRHLQRQMSLVYLTEISTVPCVLCRPSPGLRACTGRYLPTFAWRRRRSAPSCGSGAWRQ